MRFGDLSQCLFLSDVHILQISLELVIDISSIYVSAVYQSAIQHVDSLSWRGHLCYLAFLKNHWGRRNCMVVRFTINYLCNKCLLTLKLWIWILVMNRCTRYNIRFFSDLRQVEVFLRVLRFPPPIKLTATI